VQPVAQRPPGRAADATSVLLQVIGGRRSISRRLPPARPQHPRLCLPLSRRPGVLRSPHVAPSHALSSVRSCAVCVRRRDSGWEDDSPKGPMGNNSLLLPHYNVFLFFLILGICPCVATEHKLKSLQWLRALATGAHALTGNSALLQRSANPNAPPLDATKKTG
jgi:hypothetical protein